MIPIYYAVEYKHPDAIVILRNALYEDIAKLENGNYDLVLGRFIISLLSLTTVVIKNVYFVQTKLLLIMVMLKLNMNWNQKKKIL